MPSVVERRAIVLVAALAGCARPAATPPPASAPVVVRTELSELATRVTLPDGVRAARWMVVGRAPPSAAPPSAAPGPTDTALFAALALSADGWRALERRLGAPTPDGIDVPDELARALVGAAAAARFASHGGERHLTGPGYDIAPLNRSSYRGQTAIRVDDQLVFALTTQ